MYFTNSRKIKDPFIMVGNVFNFFLCTLMMVLVTVSCSNDDDQEEDTGTGTLESSIIQAKYFDANSLVSINTVQASLVDGTTADCYEITFTSDGVDGDEGPYCPNTSNDIGGLAVYDGNTNPGLRNINAEFLNDLEGDGWDIMDDDGNVNIEDLQGAPNNDVSNCLAAPYDAGLTFVYLIPVTPKLGTSNDVISSIENFGVALEGTPLTGDPPSAVNGPGGDNTSTQIAFPSIDPCGGHPDPSGYYHLHFIPQVMNKVLMANEIDEISCTLFEQTTSHALVGFAKDGYPIYAYAEVPTDLDDCYGRTAATDD